MSTRIIKPIQTAELPRNWRRCETVFAIWTGLALLSVPLVTMLLNAAFPIFTVVWLLVPLLAVLASKDARKVGFRPVALAELARVTAINIGVVILIAMLVEPWSQTYGGLLNLVRTTQPTDTTFAWLVRYQGLLGWGGLVLFSGLVTMFAEELFFRGWLLQLLLQHLSWPLANSIQATLFTLPQLLAALAMSPVQALVYVVAYSWLAVGLVRGWAAARTGSIWPSLLAATLLNLIFCLGVSW
jgi:membrane protease YdiL (CAAX protease family)